LLDEQLAVIIHINLLRLFEEMLEWKEIYDEQEWELFCSDLD
jgi:hypothetical protein